MNGELREYLRREIDRATRPLVRVRRQLEIDYGLISGRVCSACGCDAELETLDCHACWERHKRQRDPLYAAQVAERRRARELAKLEKEGRARAREQHRLERERVRAEARARAVQPQERWVGVPPRDRHAGGVYARP